MGNNQHKTQIGDKQKQRKNTTETN